MNQIIHIWRQIKFIFYLSLKKIKKIWITQSYQVYSTDLRNTSTSLRLLNHSQVMSNLLSSKLSSSDLKKQEEQEELQLKLRQFKLQLLRQVLHLLMLLNSKLIALRMLRPLELLPKRLVRNHSLEQPMPILSISPLKSSLCTPWALAPCQLTLEALSDPTNSGKLNTIPLEISEDQNSERKESQLTLELLKIL